MDDVKSLSHSKYRCKYHIVFAPKYRRQIIYKKIKADVGKKSAGVMRENLKEFVDPFTGEKVKKA